MGLLTWILLGFAGGVAVQPFMPRRDLAGIMLITALGIKGAVLGGCLGTLLELGDVAMLDLRALGLASTGALLFLAGYRAWAVVESRRLVGGPIIEER